MTSIEFIAGLLITVVVGLLYYITLMAVENAELLKQLEKKRELLNDAALEIETLKRKLEKIGEFTKSI